MYDVQTRDVPELLMVTEQRTVVQAELEQWLPGAMGRVATLAEQFGGVVTTSSLPYLLRADHPDEGVLIVSYDGNPHEGPVPVEVCALVDPDRPESADVAMRRIAAHREAYVRVTKELVLAGKVDSVFSAVGEWVRSQGLEAIGPPRETYWTEFPAAAPSDEVYDVSWPFR